MLHRNFAGGRSEVIKCILNKENKEWKYRFNLFLFLFVVPWEIVICIKNAKNMLRKHVRYFILIRNDVKSISFKICFMIFKR